MENILEVITMLISRGYHPELYKLDDKITSKLKTFLRLVSIVFQLVPPNSHQGNVSKRAIKTWKAHIVPTLCTINPLSPLHLWCRLLVHIDLTLNHLCASNLHPQLSAYHALLRKFDFDRTPIIPPGTRAMIYETPHQHTLFGIKGLEGWYMGPVSNHY